ncbi:hypothetical protein BJ741DRAFT_78458 [Chytriomyces cf. hyalinus JEL632]|nr:hypothetical protein BJ741DRAFT_78458 [Chytriomyces cf. hyalinus JEL632]
MTNERTIKNNQKLLEPTLTMSLFGMSFAVGDAKLSNEQQVFVSTITAQVQAMPACAQQCLREFDAELADALHVMNSICADQVAYERTVPICISSTCATLNLQSQATALLLNSFQNKCMQVETLFPAKQQSLDEFDVGGSSVEDVDVEGGTGTATMQATGTVRAATGTVQAKTAGSVATRVTGKEVETATGVVVSKVVVSSTSSLAFPRMSSSEVSFSIVSLGCTWILGMCLGVI